MIKRNSLLTTKYLSDTTNRMLLPTNLVDQKVKEKELEDFQEITIAKYSKHDLTQVQEYC